MGEEKEPSKLDRLFNSGRRIWSHCREVNSRSVNQDIMQRAGIRAFHVALTMEALAARIIEASRCCMDQEYLKGMWGSLVFVER